MSSKEEIKERNRKYYQKNKEKIADFKRKYWQENRQKLTDVYIKKLLSQRSKILTANDFPEDLIELKRTLLQMKKSIKDKQQKIS